MKRKILVAVLALGTIGGYGWGIHQVLGGRRCWRERAEQRIEQRCDRAARRAAHEGSGARATASPPGAPR